MNRNDVNALPMVNAAPIVVKSNRLQEAGKAGLALVMWILGVPGFLVLLYLIFA